MKKFLFCLLILASLLTKAHANDLEKFAQALNELKQNQKPKPEPEKKPKLGQQKCPICAEPLAKEKIISLPCRHKVHKHCLEFLIKEGGLERKCPECKQPFQESDIS